MRRIVEVCILLVLALAVMSSSAMPLGARTLLHGHAVARQLAEIEPPLEPPAGGSTDTVVDVGGGKSVTVPGAWIAEHAALVEVAGGNAAAALAATAANGRKVWECYVLGLDPEDNSATNDFKITSFPLKADGTPDVEHIVFDPPQARWNVPATYKVMGAAELKGPWQEVGGGGLGETALPEDCRFFKVEVVLP